MLYPDLKLFCIMTGFQNTLDYRVASLLQTLFARVTTLKLYINTCSKILHKNQVKLIELKICNYPVWPHRVQAHRGPRGT